MIRAEYVAAALRAMAVNERTAPAVERSIEQELQETLQDRTRAWLSGDAQTYARHTAASLLVTSRSGAVRVAPGYLAQSPDAQTGAFAIRVRTISHAGAFALVHYELTQYLGCEEGGPYTRSVRTDVFQRSDGRWKLVAFLEQEEE